MEGAGKQEAIWNVPVVAPTAIPMMVTVRYKSMSVVIIDNHRHKEELRK